jgi:hypothetical protein
MRAAILLAASAGLAACNQTGGGENVASNTAANTAAAETVKHPTYCFYKEANRKGWTASTDKDGNVVVKGQAKLEDSRYRGELIEAEADGDKARIWLTMTPNTDYAQPDNWWEVSGAIPGSAAVTSVTVMCGTKAVATLAVKR